MLEITNNLRPKSLIPPYPNYHKGDYFEEFFFKRFIREFNDLSINGIKYIPIYWTNCYTNKVFNQNNYEIQGILNGLPQNEKYFTISQHDDCVYENLPKNTLIFSMGGNKIGENIIPIPLICSPIKYEKKEKSINISFVGSLTHKLREELYNKYFNDSDFLFKVKNWELITDIKNVDNYIDIMSRSNFTLSPRGYGKTSFRMYESMQLDSIPIYVYDEKWLPWENKLNWDNLIIKVHISEIDKIKHKIQKIDINEMLSYKNKVYNDFFSYDGVYNNIIKTLKHDYIKF